MRQIALGLGHAVHRLQVMVVVQTAQVHRAVWTRQPHLLGVMGVMVDPAVPVLSSGSNSELFAIFRLH